MHQHLAAFCSIQYSMFSGHNSLPQLHVQNILRHTTFSKYYCSSSYWKQNESISNLECYLWYLQWIKSGTGLWTLKEAASRSLQISTLSPAMRRTAALFSSSKTCLWREAQRSNMKSSKREEEMKAFLFVESVLNLHKIKQSFDFACDGTFALLYSTLKF